MPPRRGFTVVEILIVVTIIGIMSAVILPQLGASDDLKLSAAARSLMADLSYARMLAISTQQKQYVQFTQQQYSVLHGDGGTGMSPTTQPVYGGDYTVVFGTGTMNQVSLSQATFGTQSTIGFDALGSPASYNPSNQQFTPLTSPGTIQLQSGSQIWTISIEPYTGEMSVSGG